MTRDQAAIAAIDFTPNPLTAKINGATTEEAEKMLERHTADRKKIASRRAMALLLRADIQERRADTLRRHTTDESWKKDAAESPEAREKRLAMRDAVEQLAKEAGDDAFACRKKAREITEQWAASEAMWANVNDAILTDKRRDEEAQ